MQRVALVTGSAGFIGFHISSRLLKEGWTVVGVDCLTDYYDVRLKRARLKILSAVPHFIDKRIDLTDSQGVMSTFLEFKPSLVIHLAAQAGVRYSIEDPRTYLKSNITGTFEVLEASRRVKVEHLMIASTSSAYGAEAVLPNQENQKADHQISFYAATKKACESLAHSHAHTYGLPTTMFRFFTVYGPWGRPDMALFKFTEAILSGRPIDIYNHGEMSRDFTYIDDLVEAIFRLSATPPVVGMPVAEGCDSLSSVAPFRVVNIGNSKPVKLMSYVEALEKSLGVEAKKNLLPMQRGDVKATWADVRLLRALTNFTPSTEVDIGIQEFVDWYKRYFASS